MAKRVEPDYTPGRGFNGVSPHAGGRTTSIEWISQKEALELCTKMGSPKGKGTIYNWCINFNIGKKVGGQWKVNKGLLTDILNGEF